MAEARAETSVGDIDDMPAEWAANLEEAGYDDLDSIVNASAEDLMAIPDVDEEMAQQIIELARKHEEVENNDEVAMDEDGSEIDSDDEGEEPLEVMDDSEPIAADEQQEEAKVE